MKRRNALSLLLVVALMLGCVGAMANERVPEGSWTAKKDEPVTISWFMAYDWFGVTFDPVNNLAFARQLEDTGVSIEFQSGDTDKLNMLIATNALPQVVTMDAVATQRKLLENNGALAPLEPLIQEYAPDMNAPQSMLDWYRNDDGQSYIIASFYYGDERTNDDFGGMYVTHNKNAVRMDILDQIGMTIEDIQTREGMLEACRAVKAAGIEYNGSKVIPFGSIDLLMMATQFGWKPEAEDGKLNPLYKSPEYLEALKWLNTLFNEGLMTDEVFTWNTEQRKEAIANGSIFAGVGWTGMHKDSRRALYAADNNAMIFTCGRMDQDNAEPVWYPGVSCAGWTGTMITADAADKDRIIQLFAYLCTDIATLDAEYGVDCYDIVDGKVVMKPEKKTEFDTNPTAATAKYKTDFSYFIDWTIIQKYWPEQRLDNPVEIDIQLSEIEPDILLYDNKCFEGLDPDAGTDLAAINTIIEDYWSQTMPLMVMSGSAEECEQLWNDAITQIDALGFQQLQDYRDGQFAKNKARMGVEFAYPGNRD